MPRFHSWFRILGLLVVLLWVGLPVSQTATLPSTGLMGTVKSSDGKPMEGVAVSAQGQSKTFCTSVYTNRDGEYYFPPLDAGQYRIWAQAVGFEAARSEQAISPGKRIQQNFTLKPLQDFQKQLSAVEWMNSLPADTPQDRRMSRVILYSCSTCHVTGFMLSKRFDAAGWEIIIDFMIKNFTGPDSLDRRGIEAYKDELVEYLTRIRGPQPYPWKFKPLLRATGGATEIVVTEYELPRGNRPEDYTVNNSPNGSDWSEGIASRFESRVTHDAVVGKDGNIYLSDNATPERTVGKLDPKTGRVTGYKLPGKDGMAVSTHGVIADQKGNIWLTNGTEGTILRFDPKTEKFQRFPKPSSMTRGIGPNITVDSKGNLWATQDNGAFRLNPETGEYTEYKSVTPGGHPYGITIDSEDNAWFAQLWADRVGFVNARTGEVGEVVLPPVDDKEISAKDREISKRSGTINNAPLIYQKGPRRLGADPKGDSVWVAEFYAGNLAKIDIHTKKLTEYKVPNPNSEPYSAIVDKNHMVWVSLENEDRVLKFNPFTEQFTEYPLPSLGVDVRFVDVDNSTAPPTVWLPFYRVNKIARVQFRTGNGR